MSGSINADQLVIVIAGLRAMSDISQGSVTILMRCDGIFSACLLQIFS